MTRDEARQILEEESGRAVDALELALKERGLTVDRCFLTTVVQPHDAGASGGIGFEDGQDLLAFLLASASGMAKMLGLDLQILGMPEPKGEG